MLEEDIIPSPRTITALMDASRVKRKDTTLARRGQRPQDWALAGQLEGIESLAARTRSSLLWLALAAGERL